MDSNINKDFSSTKKLEKYSSAFTLSDMEIFIFPDLFFPLILANIMSPIIWKWRDDSWFKDIDNKNFNNKANRIKQYIIDNYVFNLDLSTWGLTSKTDEIARFTDFFDIKMLQQSNALFGYEGDKYYFDIDIRKHFGLDKFDSDVIPYWKTETIEAMTAFRHIERFNSGAGECVSLAALYAAALFVVGKIPLEKIFLIATPLHSQNFVIEKDGLITNNRRIVTKNMWYNGTSLSEKARRAMENEKITIVSHISGYIHTVFNEASIDKNAYSLFSSKLKEYLVTKLTENIFINFLRFKSKYKSLFQYQCDCSGKQRFISLEKMFEYEHTSKFKVSAKSRCSLIKEIEGDEFHLSPILGKIMLNDIEKSFSTHEGKSLYEIENDINIVTDGFYKDIIHEMFVDLQNFICINPKLPNNNKKFVGSSGLSISNKDSRKEIINLIKRESVHSEMALLTLYAYRQMDEIDWLPFIKAAIERNSVCFKDLKEMKDIEVYKILNDLPNESIYDKNRLALPDEVWNFKRGDGIEKALLLADFFLYRDKTRIITIEIETKKVFLKSDGNEYKFTSHKKLVKSILITDKNYKIN
jgi:hypothetical protein